MKIKMNNKATIKIKPEKFEGRLGICFELAGEFVLANTDWLLVHAVISDKMKNTGATIVHAWCEKENACYDEILGKNDILVYDAVVAKFFKGRMYYQCNGIVDYRFNDLEKREKIPETLKVRYTKDEMLGWMNKTGVNDAWDERFKKIIQIVNAPLKEE